MTTKKYIESIIELRIEEINPLLNVEQAVTDINTTKPKMMSKERILNVRSLGNYQELLYLQEKLKSKSQN